MMMQGLFLLLGLVLLIGGGDILVRGAVRIAERLRLSPMLIGLTVVGMGTSMPELAASVQASLAGSPGIALGNIVGSNIANALLILGAAALIAPIAVQSKALWRDGGVATLAAMALLAAGASVGLSRAAGFAFLCAMAGYIYFAYRQERAGAPHGAAYDRAIAMEEVDPALVPHDKPTASLATALALFAVGLALIVAGGVVLVDAAIQIAQQLGISDAVIGLTIVAVGTSFPELVTSVIAAYRRQGDIALGNVLGSNIYNILFIGGITGVVAPTAVPASIMGFDLWVLLATSVLVMVLALTGRRLGRIEGLTLVAAYCVYLGYTVSLA
ncbi:sodium/calcium exchanger family protein [Blastomonas sp. RAC04]|jgi:cation:H+ antiporter|uniref:calcium/sodium antiporter n=1 Tax=Blastomonas TaxID=150203 RepID=UPI00083CB679|nr:calcium/sodium antiporter [Blastomonas sp. RAC04]AOG00536.1 sodium/calcium exchanger family protein [Blastomonas sp. RAC04]